MHEEERILRHTDGLARGEGALAVRQVVCWRTTNDEEKNRFTVDEKTCNEDLTNGSEELTVQSDYLNMETETHEREWSRTWRKT